jgi:hypothetical protein
MSFATHDLRVFAIAFEDGFLSDLLFTIAKIGCYPRSSSAVFWPPAVLEPPAVIKPPAALKPPSASLLKASGGQIDDTIVL